MFCKYCGEQLEDNATFCPSCNHPTTDPVAAHRAKIKLNLAPLTVAATAISFVAFLFTLVLTSIVIARNIPDVGYFYIMFPVLLPSLSGLVLSTHALIANKKNLPNLIFNIVNVGMVTFSLLYFFIAFAALLCK